MKKKVIGLCSVLLLLQVFPTFAQDKKGKNEFVKEKNISKSYSASGNRLSINNSFGNVKVISGSGNEIKVNIHIEASSNKEDVAQKILDQISVTDKQDGNNISFKTSVENKKGEKWECKGCKSNMQIDYEVTLPVSVALNIKNSFGNTELPDYSGPLSVSNKFGHLTAGSLGNVKDITVEFGEADVKSLSNIDATFKFSRISIGDLGGTNKINLEFCNMTTIGLNNNIGGLTLTESYSTVNLKPIGNISATYSINTSFGSVVDRSGTGIKRTDTPEKYGPDLNKSYSGQSGNGAAKINISSSFGKIIVGNASAEDMKDNDKAKNKTRSKEKL